MSRKKNENNQLTPATDSSSNQNVVNEFDENKNCEDALHLAQFLSSICAYKWVFYEWGVPYIEKNLLSEKNEFEKFLDVKLPRLKTRQLNSIQWCSIRSRWGKHRRFSDNYIRVERMEYERRRHMLRLLQSKSVVYVKDLELMADAPNEIPVDLPIDTGVWAVLRNPFQGIQYGSVKLFNRENRSYKVTFFTPGLNEQYISDHDVMALDFSEKFNLHVPIKHDYDDIYYEFIIGSTDYLNGYPVLFLKNYLELKHVVQIYRVQVETLALLNTAVEEHNSTGSTCNDIVDLPTNRNLLCYENQFTLSMISISECNCKMLPVLDLMNIMYKELFYRTQVVERNCGPKELYQICRSFVNLIIQRNDKKILQNPKIYKIMTDLTICLKLVSVLWHNRNAHIVIESELITLKDKLQKLNFNEFQEFCAKRLQYLCCRTESLVMSQLKEVANKDMTAQQQNTSSEK